jgi:hypothetical protein
MYFALFGCQCMVKRSIYLVRLHCKQKPKNPATCTSKNHPERRANRQTNHSYLSSCLYTGETKRRQGARNFLMKDDVTLMRNGSQPDSVLAVHF